MEYISQEEILTARKKYKDLLVSKKGIKALLDLRNQLYERNPLIKQKNELLAEIENLKKIGKNENNDSEYREYLSDLEKINKELNEDYLKIKESEQELAEIKAKMKELEDEFGKVRLIEPKAQPITPKQPSTHIPNPQQKAGQISVPQNDAPQKTALQNDVPQKSTPQNASQHDASQHDVIQQNATQQNATQQENSQTIFQPKQNNAPTYSMERNSRKVFTYSMSARGIFYNGRIYRENELPDIYDDMKFTENVKKMLGPDILEVLESRGDKFLISAIFKNDRIPEAMNKLKIYSDTLRKVYKNYEKIIIKYDLTQMNQFAILTNSCVLSKDCIDYAKEVAFLNREIADVKMGPITALQFKIREMINRAKTEKLDKAKNSGASQSEDESFELKIEEEQSEPNSWKLTPEQQKEANSVTIPKSKTTQEAEQKRTSNEGYSPDKNL